MFILVLIFSFCFVFFSLMSIDAILAKKQASVKNALFVVAGLSFSLALLSFFMMV